MSERWWITLTAILAIALAAFFVSSVLISPAPGVNYANFSRLDFRMKRDRVESFLGKPNFDREQFEGMLDLLTGPNRSLWQTQAGDFVVVGFDENDAVLSLWWNGQSDDRGPLEKLRDRLPIIARQPPNFLLEMK